MAAVKEHHNHVTVIVLVFVPQAAQMVVRENAKDVKAVVKMDAKQHVPMDVGNVAKEVVAQCVKAIV